VARRLFIVIWGALALTLLLFGMLIGVFELAPPDDVRLAIERDAVVRQLTEIARREGAGAALEHWAAIASAYPGLGVWQDADCGAQTTIVDSDGHCLSVQTLPESNRLLLGLLLILRPLLLGFLVSAGAALLLSRHLTAPIHKVGQALQRLASGDLETRVGDTLKSSGPEMIRLGAAFDHAAERLQKLSDGQRRLFNDLSHEIRSPLARLRAAVGLLEVNPDRLAEMLRQIETDIVRLDDLVSDILTLARFDSAATRPAFALLDLIDILEPILSDANFEGQPAGVEVSYDGPGQLDVTGNAELLHRALENVIRNALAHSPDRSKVLVSARAEGTILTIDVADQGIGVADADKAHMLDPFVKLTNPARQGGTGLGLAIADRAIALHGGNIRLLDNVPRGLLVRITLPNRVGETT